MSEEEKKLFISGYDVNIKSRIKIFNISNLNLTGRTQTDVVDCYEITWETGTCSSDYHHEYGDTACVLTGDDTAPKPTIIAIKDACSQYSNQNDSPDPNPNIPNDGSSGSGYDTAPYTQDEAELIEINKVFRLKLNAAQLSWYNAHTILGIDLAKLYHEDNSVAHLNFLKSVVEYMRVSDNVKDTFLYAEIIKFLKQDSSYQENCTLIQNIFNEHNPDLGIAVLNFINENPDALNRAEIINRIKALDNALAQNPNLLLDIPCGELSKWQELATHPVPVSIKNRLFQINGLTHWYQDDFAIQNLDFASGPGVNMDLFPIRITSMPFKPGTNQKYTHAEFFDFFRRNINQFAESFTPIVDSSYGIDDTSLWFSNNPLGALMHIEILGDNGTVVCSGYNTQAWIFTTIKAPITLDGLHPVSGNRLFGYYEDSNGFMYIYTRGVDRFTKPLGSVAINNLAENYAFSKADELWKGMQSKLENYINSIQNGGLANKLEPKTYRPAYAKVKEYLKDQTPLSSLGCH